MELFLTKSGPRVDINKTGGLFRKTPGRTGTRGFWPLDPDLRVLVGLIQDLIQAVAYGSGGQDRLGARAAALTAGNRVPAAAHGGEVAGLYQNGDSGLAFERNLVRERESDTLNRSRGLAQGHGTAEAWCGAEAARSYCGDRLRVNRGRKKGKQERAEVSYPRVKLRRWSRGSEKR